MDSFIVLHYFVLSRREVIAAIKATFKSSMNMKGTNMLMEGLVRTEDLLTMFALPLFRILVIP